MDKLQQLKQKIEDVQAKSVVANDLKAFATLFLKVLKESKDDFKSISDENKALISQTLTYLEQEHEKLEENVTLKTEKARKDFENALDEVKSLVKELKSIEYHDGMDGEDGYTPVKGEDYFTDKELKEIKKDILKEVPEETGETIVKKINEGESLIKAEKVEGADKFITQPNLDRALSILDQRTSFLLQKQTTSTGGGHTIQDEGAPLTQRTNLNFVGTGVTVTDGGAGPDSTIVTISAGSGDMVLASAQTNSGIKTFLDTTMKLRNVANTFDGYFVNTNTADRIYTLPDLTGTIPLLERSNTWTQVNGFTNGVVIGSSLARKTVTFANDIYQTTVGILNTSDDYTINFPSASGTIVLDVATQTLTNKTLTSPVINTGIEVGHASDTTITRESAGVLAVEGNRLPVASGFYKITVGTTEPTAPATGDLWVDTN
jgi:hypothetical protein